MLWLFIYVTDPCKVAYLSALRFFIHTFVVSLFTCFDIRFDVYDDVVLDHFTDHLAALSVGRNERANGRDGVFLQCLDQMTDPFYMSVSLLSCVSGIWKHLPYIFGVKPLYGYIELLQLFVDHIRYRRFSTKRQTGKPDIERIDPFSAPSHSLPDLLMSPVKPYLRDSLQQSRSDSELDITEKDIDDPHRRRSRNNTP